MCLCCLSPVILLCDIILLVEFQSGAHPESLFHCWEIYLEGFIFHPLLFSFFLYFTLPFFPLLSPFLYFPPNLSFSPFPLLILFSLNLSASLSSPFFLLSLLTSSSLLYGLTSIHLSPPHLMVLPWQNSVKTKEVGFAASTILFTSLMCALVPMRVVKILKWGIE